MKFSLAITLCCVALFTTIGRAELVYIGGHADIGVGFESGALHLHLHSEETLTLFGGGSLPAGEYDHDAFVIGVPGPSVGRPTGTQWNFLAAAAGSPIWFLPQGNDPSKPFLGIAREELEATDGWAGTVTWRFNSIATVLGAASEFSLYQVDGFGVPTVFASSILPTAGVGFGANSWNQSSPHDHYNFGFTAEGIYDVSFSVSAVNNGSGSITAGTYEDTTTFRFATGSFIPIAAVPEPSTFVLVSLAACGLARRRKRGHV